MFSASSSFISTMESIHAILNVDLGEDGGKTQTLPLRKYSEAIDKVPDAVCGVTEDQRGFVRPETIDADCDIGAFEFTPGVCIEEGANNRADAFGALRFCAGTKGNNLPQLLANAVMGAVSHFWISLLVAIISFRRIGMKLKSSTSKNFYSDLKLCFRSL